MKQRDHESPSNHPHQAKRKRFLEWCKDNAEDPEDGGAWDRFTEIDSFWDDMDADNREGWTDNMNKE